MTVQILASIEDKLRAKLKNPSLKISDVIDCVIGTSAGGLIALGLACGKSANDLKEIMLSIIGNTFKNPRNLIERFSEPAYNAENLEHELIKHLSADVVTLGSLKKKNPNLRVCVTSMLYNGNSLNDKFTPVIFDSDNEKDKD